MDINDHQEGTERHGQWIRQTTETPQKLKRVLVSRTKLEKHEKEIQTSFIIQCCHWGFQPVTTLNYDACLYFFLIMCRERPFMNGLPPTGHPPTRQVGPSRVHVSV